MIWRNSGTASCQFGKYIACTRNHDPRIRVTRRLRDSRDRYRVRFGFILMWFWYKDVFNSLQNVLQGDGSLANSRVKTLNIFVVQTASNFCQRVGAQHLLQRKRMFTSLFGQELFSTFDNLIPALLREPVPDPITGTPRPDKA